MTKICVRCEQHPQSPKSDVCDRCLAEFADTAARDVERSDRTTVTGHYGARKAAIATPALKELLANRDRQAQIRTDRRLTEYTGGPERRFPFVR